MSPILKTPMRTEIRCVIHVFVRLVGFDKMNKNLEQLKHISDPNFQR